MIEIDFAAGRNLIGLQFVNAIKGSHLQPLRIRFRAERTHSGGDVQNPSSAEFPRLKGKAMHVLFECTSEEHDSIEVKAFLHGVSLTHPSNANTNSV